MAFQEDWQQKGREICFIIIIIIIYFILLYFYLFIQFFFVSFLFVSLVQFIFFFSTCFFEKNKLINDNNCNKQVNKTTRKIWKLRKKEKKMILSSEKHNQKERNRDHNLCMNFKRTSSILIFSNSCRILQKEELSKKKIQIVIIWKNLIKKKIQNLEKQKVI